MPIDSLSALQPATPVFLDANIFVYGLTQKSRSCEELLERCSTERQFGVTLYEVVAEATHKMMIGEASSKGFIPKPSAALLRGKPAAIQGLDSYWRTTEKILRMDILFLALNHEITRQAQVERSAYGLLTNDSLVVAAMRLYGVDQIASNDSDFASISGITLFRPDDI